MELHPYLEYIRQWLIYSHQCSALPFAVPSCKPFWHLAIFLSVAGGSSIFLCIMYRAYRRMKAYKSYLAWLADRDKIDPDIEQKKWAGDNLVSADVSQNDLADQFREALKAKK